MFVILRYSSSIPYFTIVNVLTMLNHFMENPTGHFLLHFYFFDIWHFISNLDNEFYAFTIKIGRLLQKAQRH